MPDLPGKKQMIMRTSALLLNLVGIVMVIVFVSMTLDAYLPDNAALIAGPIVLTVLLIFFLKAEYDVVEVVPGETFAVQMPPDFVFLASKGPDGQHTRVEVMDNRMDDMFNIANYPENLDDIVMEIHTSSQAGGLSLLKKQDWPQ